jgi:hypothetical protein
VQLDFIKASEAEEARQQSAEAQRLQEMEQAQNARAEALAEREKAQQQEAEARKNEAEAQKREAAEARRVAQRTMAGLVAAVVLAAMAGWFAWTANQQRDVALMQRDRALLQESRALATFSHEASAAGDQPTALLLALQALPDPGFGGQRPVSYEAASALHQVWLRNRETALAGHRRPLTAGSFSSDGMHVVTASEDSTARVWDLRCQRPTFVALEGHRVRSSPPLSAPTERMS